MKRRVLASCSLIGKSIDIPLMGIQLACAIFPLVGISVLGKVYITCTLFPIFLSNLEGDMFMLIGTVVTVIPCGDMVADTIVGVFSSLAMLELGNIENDKSMSISSSFDCIIDVTASTVGLIRPKFNFVVCCVSIILNSGLGDNIGLIIFILSEFAKLSYRLMFCNFGHK